MLTLRACLGIPKTIQLYVMDLISSTFYVSVNLVMRIHKKLMTQKEWHVAVASPLEMAKPSIGTPVELEDVHLVGHFILDEWT